MTALHLPAYLLGRALGPLLRPLLRRVDAYVTPALDIDWSDPLTDDDDVLKCSAEGCGQPAVETLFLRDQVGHVHDCAQDAATLREWCDVVHSQPILDGECLAAVCTHNDWIWFGQPAPLTFGDDLP